jgi:hypothetical protein
VWEARERGLNERYVKPSSSGAFVGQDLPQDLMDKIKSEGARTKPAREVSAPLDRSAMNVLYAPTTV